MKQIDTTHNMIELKMMIWERLLGVSTKEILFASITLLMDKVEDLNT
jgi:hypothetical protein